MSKGPILAIEAAVGGGSLAVVSDGSVLHSWHGEPGAPRSEELLLRISEALDAARLSVGDLFQIAVSTGPGSYTGIRIGIATALGLAYSLGIPVVGISLLPAIARMGAVEECTVVVPIGRNSFGWQTFDMSNTGPSESKVRAGNSELLAEAIISPTSGLIAAQSDAFQHILAVAGPDLDVGRVVDVGRNLAVSVAFSSISRDDGLEPLYVRDDPSLRTVAAI